MANTGVSLQIDILQRTVKIRATLDRLADPVRNIEIFQPLDVPGSGGRRNWIHSNDKPDRYACLSELFRHIDARGGS